MEQLRRILKEHAMRYTKMEPVDAVKLIYQNEFGGGHLIRDEEAARRRLEEEYRTVIYTPGSEPFEEIGNGIVRVYLSAIREEDLPWLGDCFIQSARAHKGNKERFLLKLEVLRELAEEGIFSFNLSVLKDYLNEYRNKDYPMVSHSRQYREAYRPAYRIIKK